MSEERKIPEPKFYLKDELIYFLKRNAQITTEVIVEDKVPVIITKFFIDNQEISYHKSYLPKKEDEQGNFAEVMGVVQKDMENLVYHLLEQQKRIEALEKHLAQYTTA